MTVVALLTGETTTGGFCEHCLLPSVLRTTVWIVCLHCWNLKETNPVRSCDECGRQAFGDEAPLTFHAAEEGGW